MDMNDCKKVTMELEALKNKFLSIGDLVKLSKNELVAILAYLLDLQPSLGLPWKTPLPRLDGDENSKESALIDAPLQSNDNEQPVVSTSPSMITLSGKEIEQQQFQTSETHVPMSAACFNNNVCTGVSDERDTLSTQLRLEPSTSRSALSTLKPNASESCTQVFLASISDLADQSLSQRKKRNLRKIQSSKNKHQSDVHYTRRKDADVDISTYNPADSSSLCLENLQNDQQHFCCNDCPKKFKTRLALKRHLRTHGCKFQCDVCGKTLKTQDSLYHHRRGLHYLRKPYNCKLCGTSFNFYHSYKLHMHRHNGERPHKCDSCDKTYLTKSHLRVHKEAVHKTGRIICHVCGKAFSYNCSLKQHLLKHSPEQSHPCSICGIVLRTKHSLKTHTSSHYATYNFSCHVCGKHYKSKQSKNAHMKRHKEQDKRFVCEVCGRMFLFKNTLKAHLSTHNKARPYSCQQCPKSFKTRSSLYTHNYVHRQTQPYSCSICGKTFKTKNCCEAHKKRHSSAKIHSCGHCGSMFPDKGGLAKHIKTIHVPKRQFSCKLCGKKGTRADNMRAHVKSHKKEIGEARDIMIFVDEEPVSVNWHESAGLTLSSSNDTQDKSNTRLFEMCLQSKNDEKDYRPSSYRVEGTPANSFSDDCHKPVYVATSTLPPFASLAPVEPKLCYPSVPAMPGHQNTPDPSQRQLSEHQHLPYQEQECLYYESTYKHHQLTTSSLQTPSPLNYPHRYQNLHPT